MNKHDHTPRPACAHDLAFCQTCNAVYCTMCQMEWVRPCTKPHTTNALWGVQQYAAPIQPPMGHFPGAVPTETVTTMHTGHTP